MIRLALLVDSPSCTITSGLALGLVETGLVETTIVCYRSDPPPSWLPPDVSIRRLSAERVSRALPDLVRYLRTQKPDALITRPVHANFVGLAATWMARVPSRWHGKLILVQDQVFDVCHTANWHDNKWLAKIGYRFADGLMVPSLAVRDDVIRWCGLDPSSVVVIPNPMITFSRNSPSPLHPWLRDDGPPLFVNISNPRISAGVNLLIEAFAELRQSHDARLLIISEGPEGPGAAERIRQLGLSTHAKTTGRVEDVLQFAAHAWALVDTSDQDESAQVLAEAMSVGCPVITAASKGGEASSVVDNGSYGLLVPPRDRSRLADAMESILQPDIRAQYSKLGQERIKALSPTASARGLVDFLSNNLGLGK
jgi:glycosyltransferase involved in cell wall biosynthesis